MSHSAKWTFMVYLAGDNNLASAGDVDLAEMRKVGSTAEVNIVAQFDSALAGGAHRLRIKKGGKDEEIDKLGTIDSGSPRALTDFISWAAKRYPAERYALILWNHGSGWEPSEMDRVARAVGAPNYHSREAIDRSASGLRRVLFRTTLEKILTLPSAHERAICSDDNSGHSLDTIELGKVLARAVKTLGQPIDLLGMDACLMSNMEVAYQVRPYVRYMVASEEEEPNSGWPYDKVLRTPVSQPAVATDKLAIKIVDAYIRSYAGQASAGPVTQAALDVRKVTELASAVDKLGKALIAAMPQAATELWDAQRKAAHFYENTLWDIAEVCGAVESGSGSDRVKAAAKAVQAALKQGPTQCVLSARNQGASVRGCGGVSVYLIPPLTRISPFYNDLDFAKHNAWPKLLKAYHSVP